MHLWRLHLDQSGPVVARLRETLSDDERERAARAATAAAGAHFVVAKRFWEQHPELQTVVTVFSDEGEKYVSEYFLEGRG